MTLSDSHITTNSFVVSRFSSFSNSNAKVPFLKGLKILLVNDFL